MATIARIKTFVLIPMAAVLCLAACGGGGKTGEEDAALSVQAEGQPLRTTYLAEASAGQELISAEVVASGDFSMGLPVRFERFDIPRLAELRSREDLDDVIAGARSEFEKILRIKNWVAAQWPHSTPDPYPPWDAITILDWIRSGRTGGFCGQYAHVTLQSLASLGLASRYVEIGSVDNPYAHFVLEVWSNDFNKWVVLDVDFNAHFERDGIPLSALDLHDALVKSETSRVVEVLGDFREGHDYPAYWPLRTMEFYYYVRLLLKGDHLSVPEEAPFDRYNDTVEWSDEWTVPWDQSEVESEYPKRRISNQVSDDRAAFTQRLNQVRATIEAVAKGNVELRLENNQVGFSRYVIEEIGNVRGNVRNRWELAGSSTFVWPATYGTTLQIRAVSERNIAGPPAIISPEFIDVVRPNRQP